MIILKKIGGKTFSLPAKERSPEELKTALSPLAWKILKCIVLDAKYPSQVASELGVHEQKVYYHINRLKEAGLVGVAKRENIRGAEAKFYKVSKPSFFVSLKDFDESSKIVALDEKKKEFLDPFIADGKMNSIIVVGSPDPHGPEKARARDGHLAIEFAMFLGSFVDSLPALSVKLDTEMREEDFRKNLIIIGGPLVNRTAFMANPSLPVRFEQDMKSKIYYWNIHSTLSGKTYPADDAGLIVKADSPFSPGRKILLIAGKRNEGTKSAVIAFVQDFEAVCKGNSVRPEVKAKIVEGIDMDSDGTVDFVEFRE